MSRIEDGGAVEAGRDDLIMSLQDAIMMWSHSNKTVAVCYVTDAKAAIAQLQSDAAEITRLRAENAGMLEALDGIANTLSALRMQAEKDAGGRDGRMGAFLSNDIAHLIRIAALSKASQAEGQTP